MNGTVLLHTWCCPDKSLGFLYGRSQLRGIGEDFPGFWQKIQATRSRSGLISTKPGNIRDAKSMISKKHVSPSFYRSCCFYHMQKKSNWQYSYIGFSVVDFLLVCTIKIVSVIFFLFPCLANLSLSIHWMWQQNPSIIQIARAVQLIPVAPQTLLMAPGCTRVSD